MSASPWIKESGTGRYYVNRQNEHGETERRYSEELSGGHTANQTQYDREEYHTPRSESSNRVAGRADYSASQRPRRESISVSRTAEPSTDYTGRSEPLAIYNESRSGYHRSGGYDQSRDVRVRERPERHDSPPISETSQTSRRRQDSVRSHERERDVIHDEVDDLSFSLGKVTVDDLVGSPRYTTVSASAPARSGQWSHAAPRREVARIPIYEDEKGFDREPLPRSPVLEQRNDDYRDKGKAAVINRPETPPMTPAGKRHISGTEGDVEPLDDSYKYDGRGSKKRGINLHEHGLIFSSEKKPSGVKGIEKSPLRVRLSKGAERLNNPSYINYGRVYTVETNVKVKDVGELDSESRKSLRTYYNQVNTLPDEDYDGPGPARTSQARAVELAGVGGGVAGPPYFAGSQPSAFGPLAPATSMRGNYGGPQDRAPSYNQYATPSWTAAGNQHLPSQPTHLYNPAGSTGPTTIRYSAAPTYDMSRTSSNYQPPDSRYAQTSSSQMSNPMYPSAMESYSHPDARSAYAGAPPAPVYPSGALPIGSGAYPRHDSDDRRDGGFVSHPTDNRRPPLEPRSDRDSFGNNQASMERQPTWTQPQVPLSRPHPEYITSRQSESQYAEGGIDLPTLEEAQASRQRRESVSGRSGGRDRDDRGDRHRRRR